MKQLRKETRRVEGFPPLKTLTTADLLEASFSLPLFGSIIILGPPSLAQEAHACACKTLMLIYPLGAYPGLQTPPKVKLTKVVTVLA